MEQFQPVVHIRFEGQSWDIPCRELDIGPMSTEAQIRIALANHFDVAVERFRHYVIERYANGNMTVRPQAVFG